ncbi:MAG: HD domain-containing protein [Acidobacteria bacterium]|nr:HD domain-containing protein [Acidobacteriota bacterium]
MSEKNVGLFLRSLRRLMRQFSLYPAAHPLTVEASRSVEVAALDLLGGAGRVDLAIFDSAFYFDRVVLPHTSLEYHVLLRDMQARGIDSITLESPLSLDDLEDLAAFVGGSSDDLPADGTVRLNDYSLVGLEPEDSATTSVRRAYTDGIDALRSVTTSMASQGSIELSSVFDAVEGLFEHAVSHASASLLLSTVKSHDEYTFFHSVNTCILALATGRMIGVDKESLIPVGVGAVLHDIGKVAVSAATLNYPGRLDDGQWKEIQLHPQEGALAILAAGGEGHEIAATVALEHHARFDGKGYPKYQRRRRPHIFSRIVAVVDTYDAVTTRRSYRRAETPARALDVVLGAAGSSYDPDVVKVFISMMGVFPPGSILRLKTGETVVVAERAIEPDVPLATFVVQDRAGFKVSPEPLLIGIEEVALQLLPQQTDFDPVALLEIIARSNEAPAQ